MIRVVIDTNVIVSGILSPYRAPAEVIRMFIRGDLELYVDSRIIAEYEEVLERPKFSLDKRQIGFFMDFIRHNAVFVTAAHSGALLKDPADKPFLDVSIAGRVFYLITGNIRHYPSRKYGALKILTPEKFLSAIKKR